jgi:DNA-directed RNA polymerase subunit RPC12/RpoP
MNLSIECVQCEADFELELPDLIKEPRLFVCPNCGAKADPEVVEAVATSLDEAVTQMNRLRRRFRIGFSVESEDLEEDDADELYPAETEEEDALWGDEPGEEEEED